VICRNLICILGSDPFIFGGMTKKGGFEICPKSGVNIR